MTCDTTEDKNLIKTVVRVFSERLLGAVFFSVIAFVFISASTSQAVTPTSQGLTYQGRILKPDGTPLSGVHTQFILQVRSADTENCLLYQETKTEVDMSTTSGAFSLTLNDGTGTRNDTSALSFERIFANSVSNAVPAGVCSTVTTWTPGASDARYLSVQFKDETMGSFETIPNVTIRQIPFAAHAAQATMVSDFPVTSLVRVADGATLGNFSPLSSAQYSALLALANGSSTTYTQAGTLGGSALPTMTTGQVLGWNGTTWVSTPATVGPGSVSTTQLSNTLSISTTGTLDSAVTTTRDFKIYPTLPTTNMNSISFEAPSALAASYSLTWPLTKGISGDVLTSDGTGNLAWKASSAVSPWTVQAPGINYMGGNVGIGTTSPATALDVRSLGTSLDSIQVSNSAGYSVAALGTSGTNAGQLILRGPTGTQTALINGNSSGSSSLPGSLGVGTASNSAQLTVKGTTADSTAAGLNITDSSSASKLYVRNDGNVGIGTTSPASALDVVGNINASSALTSLGAHRAGSGTAAIPGYNFMNASSSGMFYPGTSALGFASNGVERIRIDSAGNVGIGTTSPTASLDILGGINATGPNYNFVGNDSNQFLAMYNGSSTAKRRVALILADFDGAGFGGAPEIDLRHSRGSAVTSTATQANDSLGAMNFQGNRVGAYTTPASLSAVATETQTGSAGGGAFQISTTQNGTTTLTERMRVDHNGNVGIGTTSPTATLQLKAGSAAAGTAPLKFTQGPVLTAAEPGAVEFDGTSLFYTDKFSVRQTVATGTGSYLPLSGGTMSGRIFNIGGSAAAPSVTFTGDTGAGLYAPNTTDLGLSAGGAEAVRIDSTGNVGIGTTSANGKLTIVSTSTTQPPFFVTSQPGETMNFDAFGILQINGILQMGKDSNIAYNRAYSSNGDTYITSGRNNTTTPYNILLKPNLTGRVGIGTTSPGYFVDVAGTLNATALKVNGVDVATVGSSSQWTTHGSNISYDVAGFVGIGTTSPSQALSIVGNIALNGSVATSGWGNAATPAFGTTTGSGFYQPSTGQLSIVTSNTDRVRIDASGNVGIGTTSPTATLHIRGAGATMLLQDSGSAYPLTLSNNSAYSTISHSSGSNSALFLDAIAGANSHSEIAFNRFNTPGAGAKDVNFYRDSSGTIDHRLESGASGVSYFAANGGQVGIGTTAPSTKLQITGSLTLGNGGETCSSTYAGALRYNTANLSVEYCNGTGWLAMTSGANTYTSNTSMVQNASGAITIQPAALQGVVINATPDATSSTTGALTVGGGIGAAGNIYSNESMNAATSVVTPLINGRGTGNLTINGNAGATGNVLLATDGGKVGIGTTSPASTLDVNGTVNIASNTTSNGQTQGALVVAGGLGVGGSINAGPSITTNRGDGTAYTGASASSLYPAIGPSFMASNFSSAAGEGSFFVGKVQATNQEYGYFGVSSNPGAGTYSPNLVFGQSSGSNAYTERMRIDASGNVGIGTTSPTQPLDVNGTARFSTISLSSNTINSETGPIQLKRQAGAAAASLAFFDSTNTSVARITTFTTGGLGFQDGTGATEYMRIAGGNVGIGTTSPGALLDVNGQGKFNSLSVGTSSLYGSTVAIVGSQAIAAPNAAPTLSFFRNGSADVAGDIVGALAFAGYDGSANQSSAKIYGVVTSGSTVAAGSVPTDISFNTGSNPGTLAERLRITSGGNVGIGTTSPSALFEVSALNALPANSLAVTNTSTSAGSGSNIVFRGTTNINMAYIGNILEAATSDSALAFYTRQTTGNPSEKMRITASGNVGIGTTSPSYKLDVQDTVAGEVRLSVKNNSTNGGAFTTLGAYGSTYFNEWRIYQSGAGNSQIQSNAEMDLKTIGALPIHISPNGTEVLRATPGGRVGIGTTSPSEVLEVNGNVKAVSFISTSDRRLKENIKPISGLDLVTRMNGVQWNWRSNGATDAGVIAQDLEGILPFAVVTDSRTGLKAVKYNALIAPLIESTKELHGMCLNAQDVNVRQDREIASLRTTAETAIQENKKLKQEVESLRSRLDRLEKLIEAKH